MSKSVSISGMKELNDSILSMYPILNSTSTTLKLVLDRTWHHPCPETPIYGTDTEQNITLFPTWVPHLPSWEPHQWHCRPTGHYFITILRAPTLTLLPNRSLLHYHPETLPWLQTDHYFIPIHSWIVPSFRSVVTTEDTDPNTTLQQIIPHRCVLSITTQIGLPSKFDTLAIV